MFLMMFRKSCQPRPFTHTLITNQDLVVVDTPRGLISRGQREKGLKNMCILRGLPAEHPYVHQEYSEVCAQVDAEQELSAGKQKTHRGGFAKAQRWLTLDRNELLACHQGHRHHSIQLTSFLPCGHPLHFPQVHRD